jgi:streptogramin lyase
MKFHTSRKSLKKLSILALALLPLGYATAASAEPVVSSPVGGFNQPIGIIYLNNQIIVGNWGNGTLQTIDPATGNVGDQVSPIGGSLLGPEQMAQAPNGNLWVTNQRDTTVTELHPQSDGTFTVVSTLNTSTSPDGITFDVQGNMFVSNQLNHNVEEFSLVNGSYAFQGIAFTLDQTGSSIFLSADARTMYVGLWDGGVEVINVSTGAVSTFATPNISAVDGVALDGAGNIWTADFASGYIVELSPDGTVLNSIDTHIAYGENGTNWGLYIDPSGNIWFTNVTQNTVSKLTGSGAVPFTAFVPLATGPDTVSNLAVATVGHTTLKLTWGSSNASDTQYVCTASNGASVTVSGNSCLLKGFDLYHSGNYTVSVTAVNTQGQSDPVTLNVQL